MIRIASRLARISRHVCGPGLVLPVLAGFVAPGCAVLEAGSSCGPSGKALLLGDSPAVAEWLERTPFRFLVEIVVAGNELWRWGAIPLGLLAGWLTGRLARWLFRRLAAEMETRDRKVMATALRAAARASVCLAMAIACRALAALLILEASRAMALELALRIFMIVAIGFAAYSLSSVADQWLRGVAGKSPSRLSEMLAPLAESSLRVVILAFIAMALATAVLGGEQITSLLAGLGVGGLAAGLAAQDTLKALFGSLTLVADRPFELGDNVVIEGVSGTVEAVGFRSTRIRTGEGHWVTIPNGQLVNKTIVNISRRTELVRKFHLAIDPQENAAAVERAIALVKEILARQPGLRSDKPPRVFLEEITPQMHRLTAEYWHDSTDPVRFAAVNEAVNLAILRHLGEQKIALAKPPWPL